MKKRIWKKNIAAICTSCGSNRTCVINGSLHGCHSCGEEFKPNQPHKRYEMMVDNDGNIKSRTIIIPVHPNAAVLKEHGL